MEEIHIILTVNITYLISFLLFLTVYHKRIRTETKFKFIYTFIMINLTPDIVLMKIIVPIVAIIYNAYYYYKDMKLYNEENSELKKKINE